MGRRVLGTLIAVTAAAVALLLLTPAGGIAWSNASQAAGLSHQADAGKSLRGPRGRRGRRGYKGRRGPRGRTGPTGLTGAQGLQGLTGLKGDKGLQGAIGGSAVHCSLAKAKPRTYTGAPCGARTRFIDHNGDTGGYSSLAIGADGNPVISYADFGNARIMVAHCNDRACAGGDETVKTVDPSAGAGETSLAIGADGNPIVAYHDTVNHALKVAHCRDLSCAAADPRFVDSAATADTAGNPSIAIGTDGNPVIAYYDIDTKNLRIAHCNDPVCAGADEAFKTFTTADDDGTWASLAIGTDGKPVVSYYDATSADLAVLHCTAADCSAGSSATVASVGSVGQHSALAVGADGKPVISYTDETNIDPVGYDQKLMVAHCNDVACADASLNMVAYRPYPGMWSSIAIGMDGNPVISHSIGPYYGEQVVFCNDPACAGQNERAVTFEEIGFGGYFWSSIAIGTDGVPILSYYPQFLGGLKIARVTGAP